MPGYLLLGISNFLYSLPALNIKSLQCSHLSIGVGKNDTEDGETFRTALCHCLFCSTTNVNSFASRIDKDGHLADTVSC